MFLFCNTVTIYVSKILSEIINSTIGEDTRKTKH